MPLNKDTYLPFFRHKIRIKIILPKIVVTIELIIYLCYFCSSKYFDLFILRPSSSKENWSLSF